MCINGGPRQDVQQVHFHLFTGTPFVNPLYEDKKNEIFYSNNKIIAFEHFCPNWEIHIILAFRENVLPLTSLSLNNKSFVKEIVEAVKVLNERFQLVKNGYTLFIQEVSPYEKEQLICHIVSGKMLHNINRSDYY